MNILLWILQILLALAFLFAGGTKLVLPTEVLNSMAPPNSILFPGWFLKFIGLCEVLGALGLILPGVFHRKQHLTILAAIGFLIIMIGAMVVTFITGGVMAASSPFVFAVLCLFIAYGRWKVRPLR